MIVVRPPALALGLIHFLKSINVTSYCNKLVCAQLTR